MTFLQSNNDTISAYNEYIFKQHLKHDPVLYNYVKSQSEFTQDNLNAFRNFSMSLKKKKALLQIGKSVIKSILCNTKNSIIDITKNHDNTKLAGKLSSVISPIFKFIEPENIETKLTDDEYLALINDMVKKEIDYKTSNVYMVIITNMLMSVVTSNLTMIFDVNNIAEHGLADKVVDISDDNVDKLYEKVVNKVVVDVEEDEKSPDPIESECNTLLEDETLLTSSLPTKKRKKPNMQKPKRCRKKLTFENDEYEAMSDEDLYSDEIMQPEEEIVSGEEEEKGGEEEKESAELQVINVADNTKELFDMSTLFTKEFEMNIPEKDVENVVEEENSVHEEELEPEPEVNEESENETSDVLDFTPITEEEVSAIKNNTSSINKMLEMFKKSDVTREKQITNSFE
nr:hypothetical protein MmNV_77 [Menippe mercenaria nudivirus]